MIECKEVSREDIAHRVYDLYTQMGLRAGEGCRGLGQRGIRARRRAEHHISKREGCTFRPIQLT
jgi:hypothetical protein